MIKAGMGGMFQAGADLACSDKKDKALHLTVDPPPSYTASDSWVMRPKKKGKPTLQECNIHKG